MRFNNNALNTQTLPHYSPLPNGRGFLFFVALMFNIGYHPSAVESSVGHRVVCNGMFTQIVVKPIDKLNLISYIINTL